MLAVTLLGPVATAVRDRPVRLTGRLGRTALAALALHDGGPSRWTRWSTPCGGMRRRPRPARRCTTRSPGCAGVASGPPTPEALRRYPGSRVPAAVVPAGHVVVVGDNPNSQDSRQLGYVPVRAIAGRVHPHRPPGDRARPRRPPADRVRPHRPPADR